MSQAIDETEIQSNDRVDRDPVDTPLRPRSKTEKIDFAICKALQAGDLHSQELFRIVKPEYNSIFYARLACLTEIGVVSRTKSLPDLADARTLRPRPEAKKVSEAKGAAEAENKNRDQG